MEERYACTCGNAFDETETLVKRANISRKAGIVIMRKRGIGVSVRALRTHALETPPIRFYLDISTIRLLLMLWPHVL